MKKQAADIIDHDAIESRLHADIDTSKERIREILAHGRELSGIGTDEALALLATEDPELVDEMCETAHYIKGEIYGKRLVLFAPLYISNLCNNECLYCAFRKSNSRLVRRALDQGEIRSETQALLAQGHKRVLLVAGESYPDEGLQYIFDSIKTTYDARLDGHNIRRVNVNIAPLTVEEFRELHACGIGTYQLFQETYHRETYGKLHLKGKKRDYDWRVETMDRAFEGGFDDVGIGILFGLADWKYEILALMEHINHLEDKFGVGPHTISVPRLEPALGSNVSAHPPYPISNADFRKIIAALRVTIPYTGIILSTRETAAMRRAAFDLGVSQISAGSRTNPGGYGEHNDAESEGSESQFSLGDHRPMMEVIRDITEHGYTPSFCTGCYRLGRVGKDFMDLAKPGLIKKHCLPNAMFTFTEYIEDFADAELKEYGNDLIDKMIDADLPNDNMKSKVRGDLARIRDGERDIYY